MFTTLKPKKRNATRWTGAVDMQWRNIVYRDGGHIDAMDSEMSSLLPSPSQELKIRNHIPILEKFESITKALQSSERSILDARSMFYEMVAKHPHFQDYISPSSQIVHSPVFECAIVKLQSRREATLSDMETLSVVRLIKPSSVATDALFQDEKDYATQLLKCKRLERDMASGFLPASFLLPTSNDVERLFSIAKNVDAPSRRSLHPRTLEKFLFLHCNLEYWNVQLVSQVVNAASTVEDDALDSDSDDN
ncbi:hypothetical protein AeRB84_009435 [Aphanomyces euteiches]|nr:hypothetical protein AeRB84_009435 [Aphanomyces euteiches]